jgi:DNA helicase-2/ATP-dependent DNA helicase PcrA
MRRGGRGYAEDTVESRFLEDIPQELISGKGRAPKRRSSHGAYETWSLPSPKRPAPIIESKFRVGMRVKHPIWNDGIVLDSRMQDDDEIVDVVFESVGIKRLAASLANLTVVK